MGKKSVKIFILFYFFYGVQSNVEFLYFSTEQCLDQQVEYQCTVTGSGPLILTWRVLYNNGTQLVAHPYTSSALASGATIGGGLFTVEQIQESPLVSNISFTVKSNINGYTIICEDSIVMNNMNFTISILGPPTSPIVNIDNFTSSSVGISWTGSSPSKCVTGYNVSSTAIEENIITEPTSLSTILEVQERSDNPYTVVVFATDIAGRTNESTQACFIFNSPPEVENVTTSHISTSETTVNVTVDWDSVDFLPSPPCSKPDFIGYVVTLKNSSLSVDWKSSSLSMDTMSFTFSGVPMGAQYTIAVICMNVVGSRSSTDSIDVPGTFVPPPPLPSSTSSFIMPSSTYTSSSSPSSSTARSTTTRGPTSTPTAQFPIAGIAGGVAGGIIFILLVIIVALLLVYFLYVRDNSESVDIMGDKRGSDPIPLKETKQSVQQVHAQQPETGQGFYQDPNAIEHEQAPTGDVYARPDKSAKRRPAPQGPKEIPTYQDPNTIQREQAHTGDMYSIPEKKPVYSQVNRETKAEQTMYAELELEGRNHPQSPSGIPLIQSEHKQVVYSDVHGK